MINKTLLTASFLLTLGFSQAQNADQSLSNDSLTKLLNVVKHDVDNLKNIKVSGWIQAQMQWADSNGVANFDGGNFAPNSDKRFMIRRGRVKFTYNQKNSQYVMQINGTERGLNLVEIYGVYTEPWLKSISLTAGVMNRPFGFEIAQSSVDRESPERSRYTQILMPNERDLGAKLSYLAPAESPLHGLRIDAGMYNGQGVNVPGTTTTAGYPANTFPTTGVNEFDFQKDFIGRLSYYRGFKNDKVKIGLGASHYNGGYICQSNKVYKDLAANAAGYNDWKAADTSTIAYKGKIAPRVYTGVEAFFSISTPVGTTTLRGEYIMGTQPGTSTSSASPSTLPGSTTIYIRQFNGFYAYFIQRIAKTKHEVLVKFEAYDPNTKISGKDMLGTGKNSFTGADIKYTQLGIGYNYYLDPHVKFMLHYNIITNETTGDGTTGISGFTKDLKDNILTLRMTYRF